MTISSDADWDKEKSGRDGDFYQLVHPGGPGGVVSEKPEMRAQDAAFEPAVLYAAVFFPKLTCLGHAQFRHADLTTLSKTPEAARTKFMDAIASGETWAVYHDAGWRIRKVEIQDLGDSTPDDAT